MIISPFTRDDFELSSNKIKTSRAPGPGGITNEMLQFVVQTVPDYAIVVYNELVK